jgi:hypothetical protein
VGDLVDRPVLSGERFKALEPFGRGVAGAGGMPLAANDQQVAVGAHRAGARTGADRHAVRRFASDERGGDAMGTHRFQPGEVKAAVEDRVMGGDDHMLRVELAGGRGHSARRALAHALSTRALEHARAIPVHGGGQTLHVAHRVQLQLLVESDGAVCPVREIWCFDEGHRESRPSRVLELPLDRVAFGLIGRIRVRGATLVLARDPLLGDDRCDAFHAGEARLRIHRRCLITMPSADRRVHGCLKSAHLGRCAAGDAGADTCSFEHRDPGTLALQQQRNRQAGDPAADHGYIDRELPRERGAIGWWRGVEPE